MGIEKIANRIAAKQIRHMVQQLIKIGSVTGLDGNKRAIFPVALSPGEASALRDWVCREKAVRTVEIGLAFAFSTLHICEGLILNGDPEAHHTTIDPNQTGGYASSGLTVLKDAGVDRMIEHHNDKSQLVLPQFLKEGRCFDLAFIDGNHRFDAVFVDLYYLGQLVRKGGLIILDDYNLPGIRRAVSFFVTNLGWTVEDTVDNRMVVLRTPTSPDTRDFRFFVEF
jgi:predicted O-methyltransferase YrrM